MTYGLTSEMHFKAEEAGIFVYPLKGTGEILSVYSKALNILHPDQHLVPVVKAQSRMTSLSLSLPERFSDSKNKKLSLRRGDKVHFYGSRMRFNDLEIDLAVERVWRSALLPKDVEGLSIAKPSLLKNTLLEEGKGSGFLGCLGAKAVGSIFERKASEILDGLGKRGRGVQELKGLSQLVGLGVGFTPSGDDFIAGALIGEKMLELISNDQVRMSPLSIDKREIRAVLKRTNHGGRTLLWQAFRGHFPYYMIEAARGSARAREPDEVIGVVSNASNHGETSGTDALVGRCWYLEASAETERRA